ncbi:PTS system mannitol-specific IIB component / PTS system mannitol-specific IIC component [Lactococcus cremoris]|nr:PTS system mannitol-specific IIB component / PTS system mannitol-specific IIC component [Lactococcus cremoris]KZK43931.1 PTS system mannitol-specific IIB component / PTS system mannitol-specific IIC component [Lactococcus cremoris]KZK49856.1 PTS system mannitol-specific IIB component / PTS system mannitol-specific IIC component [Lactococcus cremoris]
MARFLHFSMALYTKQKAPNAQHLSVESLITTPEYINMVNRMNK